MFYYYFTVDEGSYEPNEDLKKIKAIAEEALQKAHDLKLIKTKVEADNEPEDSD